MVLTPQRRYAAPPTALWVVPVGRLAGVARHVLDVAGHGIPGWRVVVLCPPGPLAGRLEAMGAPVLAAAVGPEAGVGASVRSVRHALRTLRPAVVHSHLPYADLVVSAAGVGSGAALVSTEHGIAADDAVYHGNATRSATMAAVHGVRLRRVDAVVAVSQATARAIRDKWHPPADLPIRVVRNGVDPLADRPGTGRPGPGLHVVSLSRLAPEKRLPDLLESFALLLADHPEARLTVAGEGPLGDALATLRTRLGLQDAVDLPGHVDPVPLLRSADVLAQLSVWENGSYAVLDALVHGVGVAATAVGGNVEMLPPRCLVDADDHRSVAEVLLEQASEPSARPALPGGWPTVQQMCASVADVYAEVGA